MRKRVDEFISALKSKEKLVAMIAPSFVAEFDYPDIVVMLKDLGIDQTVELTFGAKMINRDYHKTLKESKDLVIASVCPGIVETIKKTFPQYEKNLIKVDSPLIATGKICRKTFPKHKNVFISPCDFKKIEAENSKYIDYVVDYQQLKEIFKKYKIKKPSKKKKVLFDKFYNDYTKIYPLGGGLSKTAHLKGIIKEDELKVIDGIANVMEFLKNPDPKIKFLDVTFCVGGCIGGPRLTSKLTIEQRKQKVLDYMEFAKHEDIPEERKGLIKKAEGIDFTKPKGEKFVY